MKRTGFTLIEFLTVIAIICLLAAVLFPIFERARQRAQSLDARPPITVPQNPQ